MKSIDAIQLFIFLIFFNFLVIIFFDKLKIFFNINDIPDKKRKIHLVPTPLLGGMLITLNLIISLLYLFFFEESKYLYFTYFQNSNKSFLIFIFVFTSLFLIGVLDDKFSLSPIKRFFFISFLIFFMCTTDYSIRIDNIKFSFLNIDFDFNQLSKSFTICCFLVLIISMNMFDGINLQSFLFYSTNFISFLILTNVINPVILSLIIGLIFFGYLNFKNKCFLGDSGTYLLSFLLGFYLIRLHNNYDFVYTDTIVNFLFLPVVDSIRVIIKRIIQNKAIFLPDKSHLHHRLLKKYGFNKTIICIYSIIILPHILFFLDTSGAIIFLLQTIIYTSTIIISKNVSH